MRSARLLFLLLCLTAYLLSSARAQDIVKYTVRPTLNEFPQGTEPNLEGFLKMMKIDKGFKEFEKDPMRYSKKFSPVFELKRIPLCLAAQVKKSPVSVAPQAQLSGFNYLFYSADIPSEVERAKQFGELAVAYKAGKYSLTENTIDIRSIWASVSQIKCLPTRVYLVNESTGASIVHAEGEDAWKVESQ